MSYGEVPYHRHGDIIRGLATPHISEQSDANAFADVLIKRMLELGIETQAKWLSEIDEIKKK